MGKVCLNFSKWSFRLTLNPIRKSGVFLFFKIRDIVQLVVCVLWEHEVAGSSPAIPTNRVWARGWSYWSWKPVRAQRRCPPWVRTPPPWRNRPKRYIKVWISSAHLVLSIYLGHMVEVAQLVERQIVVLRVAGSIPVFHPKGGSQNKPCKFLSLRLFFEILVVN